MSEMTGDSRLKPFTWTLRAQHKLGCSEKSKVCSVCYITFRLISQITISLHLVRRINFWLSGQYPSPQTRQYLFKLPLDYEGIKKMKTPQLNFCVWFFAANIVIFIFCISYCNIIKNATLRTIRATMNGNRLGLVAFFWSVPCKFLVFIGA